MGHIVVESRLWYNRKPWVFFFIWIADRTNDCLYFGDEVEYTLVKFYPERRVARLNLKAQYYLEKLEQQKDEGKVSWQARSSLYPDYVRLNSL